jgi:hypothetical protein
MTMRILRLKVNQNLPMAKTIRIPVMKMYTLLRPLVLNMRMSTQLPALTLLPRLTKSPITAQRPSPPWLSLLRPIKFHLPPPFRFT